MDTNGVNIAEDADMAECDGDKVVTMMDVLQEQEEFEEDANAVLGASDDKNCTFSMGYVKRQAIYACLTCCSEAKSDPTKRAGVCLACSLACHENHELIELYTKRNFRCDCGNPKFNSNPCLFTSNKPDLNEENIYNQNFSGIYCVCHRPYPDPETEFEDEMIQCIICEDWLHAAHLDAVVPSNDQYSEMVCKSCMEKNEFLHDYSDLAANVETGEIDIIKVNGDLKDDELTNGTTDTVDETAKDNQSENIVQENQILVGDVINNEKEDKDDNDIAGTFNEDTILNSPEENNKVENDAADTEEHDKMETENPMNEKAEKIGDECGHSEETSMILQDKPNEESKEIENTTYSDDKEANSASDLVAPSTEVIDGDKQTINDSGQPDTEITETNKEESDENIDAQSMAKIEENEQESKDLAKEELKSVNKVVENKTDTNSQDEPTEMPSIENDKHLEEMIAEETKNITNNPLEPKHTIDDLPSTKNDKHLEERVVEEPSKITNNSLDTKDDKTTDDASTIENDNHSVENHITSSLVPEQDITEDNDDERNKHNKEHIEAKESEIASEQNIENETNKPHDNSDSVNEVANTDKGSTIVLDTPSKGNDSDTPPKDVSTLEDIEMKEDNIVNSNKDQNTEVDSHDKVNEKEMIDNDDNSTPSNKENESPNIADDNVSGKRKLSVDEEDKSTKKPKIDDCASCMRPHGIKRIYKGATFWPSTFRQKLCTCAECISMYKDLSLLFLIDPEDTVTAYETLGKEKIDGAPTTQYEKGLQALSSLDRIQQINALTEYNKMRDKLVDFLKSFKDRKEIVKEEDIKAFFAGMKPTRQPDGVYFCR